MDTIFVQIASYRDHELPKTIENCLQQADAPDRLRFGICWQYDESTFTDLDPFLNDPRFRVAQFYYKDSLGCCWARHHTNQMYQNERYMLQIDAHMRFDKGWDTKLIDMLSGISKPKPLLTTYPPPYEVREDSDFLFRDRGIQKLKLKKLRRNLTTEQVTDVVKDTSAPGKSPLIAAGLIFTLGKFCTEVPYDPELYFLGEEVNLAVRAYTHGYDFFFPNMDVIWHRYDHPMPLHWSDHRSYQKYEARSDERLADLLLQRDGVPRKYGLGEERSLEDFEHYANLNFKERYFGKPQPCGLKTTLSLDFDNMGDRSDHVFWILSIQNDDHHEIHRIDIHDRAVISGERTSLDVDIDLPDKPARFMIWPFSQSLGYVEKHFRDID